jgi:hypothetical protein
MRSAAGSHRKWGSLKALFIDELRGFWNRRSLARLLVLTLGVFALQGALTILALKLSSPELPAHRTPFGFTLLALGLFPRWAADLSNRFGWATPFRLVEGDEISVLSNGELAFGIVRGVPSALLLLLPWYAGWTPGSDPNRGLVGVVGRGYARITPFLCAVPAAVLLSIAASVVATLQQWRREEPALPMFHWLARYDWATLVPAFTPLLWPVVAGGILICTAALCSIRATSVTACCALQYALIPFGFSWIIGVVRMPLAFLPYAGLTLSLLLFAGLLLLVRIHQAPGAVDSTGESS